MKALHIVFILATIFFIGGKDVQAQTLRRQTNISRMGIPPGNYSGITRVNDTLYAVVNDKEILNGLSAMLPYGRLETAPVAIIVCGDMSKTLEGDARDFWVVDCSMMAENILLAAHAHGLGAVFTGAWPTKERGDKVKEYLGMPENYEVLGVIPMGYPAENPEPKDKWNPDAVHYNSWK